MSEFVRPKCPDCSTPYRGAAGPYGTLLVPACWCAEDRRKAEAQVAWEKRKAEGKA